MIKGLMDRTPPESLPLPFPHARPCLQQWVTLIAIGLLLLTTGCATTQDPTKPSPETPATRTTGNEMAEVLAPAPASPQTQEAIAIAGQKLFQKYQFANRAMKMLSNERIDPDYMGLTGWVTIPDGADGWRTCFLTWDEAEAGYRTLYEVIFPAEGRSRITEGNRQLADPTTQAMFRAAQDVITQIERPCSPNYLPVILPHPEEKGWLAYALALPEDEASIQVGGHLLAHYDETGTTLIDKRAFTETCLVLPREMAESTAQDHGQFFIYLSHLLDDTPTEIHVFLSLLHEIPILVDTPTSEQLWLVNEGHFSPATRDENGYPSEFASLTEDHREDQPARN